MAAARARNGDLSVEERTNIVAYLLATAVDLELPRGALLQAATKFNCSAKTAERLWHKSVESLEHSGKLPDLSPSARSRCGRKKIDRNIGERIRLVPFQRRQNMRSLAAALKVPNTTLARVLAEGEIVRHSNSVMPFLTEKNKVERLSYCLSFVDPSNLKFCEQEIRIHIDEKWFYLTRADQMYNLTTSEAPPVRSCSSTS